MSHLIIKPQRPYQIAAIAICVSLGCFLVAMFFVDDSHWSYIKSRLSVNQETRQLFDENRALARENEALKEQLVMLQRTTQIDGQAAAEIHSEMKKLQDELFRVKGDLEFYQSIMTATGKSSGLTIQGLKIRSLSDEEAVYHFKLILTQVAKDDKVAEGMIEITLEGLQDGISSVLNFSDLVVNPAFDMSFSFTNFKRMEGNIMLPTGFTPHQITVRLHQGNSNLSSVKRVFNWSELAG